MNSMKIMPQRTARTLSPPFLLVVCLTVFAIAPLKLQAATATPGPPSLFRTTLTSETTGGQRSRGVLWERAGRLDLASLKNAAGATVKGKRELLFAPEPGVESIVRMEGMRDLASGGWVVKGGIEGRFGGRVLFVDSHGQIAGTVNLPGEGVYVVTGPEGGDCHVRKLDPLQVPVCGLTEAGLKKAIDMRNRKLTSAGLGGNAAPDSTSVNNGVDSSPAIGSNNVRPLDSTPTTIDIMVVYTAQAAAGGGGPSAMEALAQLAVEEANDCYVNSQINVRLNLVHTEQVPYTESGDISQDLANEATDTNIKALRIGQFKADLVCLFTEFENTGYIAGIAYLLQGYPTGSPELGFSVVLRPYAVGIYAFAHEVGHNLGCAHDRDNAGGPGTFSYSYGNRFNALGVTYATVMTYPPGVRIPYFSNPQINYNGVPTGIGDTDPNAADNAFTINQTAPNTVSKYYTASRQYSFAQPTYTVLENAGQIALTVHLAESASTTSTRSVRYATSDGTALAGQRYTATSGTLTFASGQTDATVTISLINDSIAEPPQNFFVTLSNPSPIGTSAVGANYQAAVTIEDDEKSFYFGSSNTVVSEALGQLAVSVFRQGTTNGSASVTVRPVPGSATAGGDFNGADVVASFADGELSKTVNIPLVNDFVVEPDKTFTLTLVSPSTGFALTSPSSMAVTLLDDDRPGALDVAFNSSSGPNDNVFALASRPDGRVVVGGGFARVNGNPPAAIAQFNADGSLDNSFSVGIGVSGTVYALGMQPDGKVVLGGVFTAVSGVTRNNLARLNPDGSLDAGFNPGLGPDDVVRSLAVMSDGRIVIGGFFLNYQGQSRPYVARVLTNATLDTTFNPGTGPSAPVRTVVVQSDNRVVIGGDFTSVGGTGRGYVARLNADGTLDANFVSNTDGAVRALALTADGQVVMGGEFSAANGQAYSFVARLTSAGSTDATFNVAARPNGIVRALALQTDQKILVGGDFTTIGGQSLGRVGRLNPDGTVDGSFTQGTGANDSIYGLTTATGNFVVVGGAFDQFSGLPRAHVARLRITPNVDNFNPILVPLARSDLSGGPITIHFEGRSGTRYALDGSSDLASWSGIVTNIASADATQLTDPAPPATRRFYRVRRVP